MRRLPPEQQVFRGLGCGFVPFGGFCVPIWWLGCLVPSLYEVMQYTVSLPATAILLFFALR